MTRWRSSSRCMGFECLSTRVLNTITVYYMLKSGFMCRGPKWTSEQSMFTTVLVTFFRCDPSKGILICFFFLFYFSSRAKCLTKPSCSTHCCVRRCVWLRYEAARKKKKNATKRERSSKQSSSVFFLYLQVAKNTKKKITTTKYWPKTSFFCYCEVGFWSCQENNEQRNTLYITTQRIYCCCYDYFLFSSFISRLSLLVLCTVCMQTTTATASSRHNKRKLP